MNKEMVLRVLESTLLRHTAQAIGGALTYTGVNPGNGLSVDSFSTALAGVILQTAVYGFAKWRQRRAAKKAAKAAK